MPNILVNNNFYQGTTQACIVDLTPPTFGGIVSAVVQSRGQIRASWFAATDATGPIRYEIYIQANTATGLFNVNNIIAITNKLQYDTFTMPDGSFLVNGTTYYLGVRAIDGVSNRDSNVVSQNVISTGVSVSADVYQAEGAFALGANSMFQGTMWILKNSVLGIGPTLGTASYQVYDKNGTAVPGMGQSGIVADANGQFKITPVLSTLSETLDHYMIKVDILMDSAIRTGYIALIEPIPLYKTNGQFTVNDSNNFIGSFWAQADGQNVTNLARLGDGHYQVHDQNGTPVPGMTESGISANASGAFIITPIPATLDTTNSLYFVHAKIVVDGVERESTIPLSFALSEYEAKGIFSINALNQFQATLWATENGVIKASSLGTANYTVYDATGAPVAGLAQSGITADVNGRFQISPVSAALLTDLTHYSVKIGIVVDGVERVSYRGFTLLGN